MAGILFSPSFALFAAAQTLDTSAQREQLEELKSQMSDAEKAKRELEEKAAKISIEVSDLRTRLIKMARIVQEREVRVTRNEEQVLLLEKMEKEQKSALTTRREQLAGTLAAMQRLSQMPPQLVLVKPDSALNTARSSDLLGAVLPALQDQATEIRKEIRALGVVRTELEAERLELGQELNRLNAERENMDRLMAERRDQQKSLESASKAEQKRLLEMAGRARDISALIEELEREAEERRQEAEERQRAAEEAAQRLAQRPEEGGNSPKPVPARRPDDRLASLPPSTSLENSLGQLPLPVRGNLVRKFGENDDTGFGSKGIQIEARPNAQVISPTDGRIVFAGPFRGYGRLIIIAHGKDYHTLLAGVGRIDGVVGQWVLAGEPVGQMGSTIDTTGQAGSKLYVEIRKQGKPINPLPYLASGLGKVSG